MRRKDYNFLGLVYFKNVSSVRMHGACIETQTSVTLLRWFVYNYKYVKIYTFYIVDQSTKTCHYNRSVLPKSYLRKLMIIVV